MSDKTKAKNEKMIKKKFKLEDLLRGINKDNIHEEVDFGKPVGNELL